MGSFGAVFFAIGAFGWYLFSHHMAHITDFSFFSDIWSTKLDSFFRFLYFIADFVFNFQSSAVKHSIKNKRYWIFC